MAFMSALTDEQIQQDPQQQLKAWRADHEFLVCLDTDGHALDNMWAKQLIVFHPHFMDMNSLRDIEMHFRIHAEHHNLWGTTRGCDRYEAVRHTLTSLLVDPEAKKDINHDHIKALLDSVSGYINWVNQSGGAKAYGIPSLFEYHKENGLDYNITRLLAWSESVDRTFPHVTLNMPPFPNVPEMIEYIAQRADILVVSATPYRDLAQWWHNAGLDRHVQAIAGKEMGKKAEHIRIAREQGGYADDHVIMGGDGGGDLKAAKANDALFFPTPAGKEVETWASAREAFDAFFAGTYQGDVEDARIAEFKGILKEHGPWECTGYNARQEYMKLQQKRIDTYKELHPNGKLLVIE